MKKEVELAVRKLGKALDALRPGVLEARDDLDKDGVIQRFEFTFELLWKGLKIYLADQGIDVATPKESLKAAFRIGLIENEEVFLDMLDARNKTSHLYDQETSEEIFEAIQDLFAPEIGKVFEKMRRSN